MALVWDPILVKLRDLINNEGDLVRSHEGSLGFVIVHN